MKKVLDLEAERARRPKKERLPMRKVAMPYFCKKCDFDQFFCKTDGTVWCPKCHIRVANLKVEMIKV